MSQTEAQQMMDSGRKSHIEKFHGNLEKFLESLIKEAGECFSYTNLPIINLYLFLLAPVATYCICKQPWNHHDETMIACVLCEEWFHGNCVGIAKDDSQDNWLCPMCQVHVHEGYDKDWWEDFE
jgi:PHD-finger